MAIESYSDKAPKSPAKQRDNPKPAQALGRRSGLMKNASTDSDSRLDQQIRPKTLADYIGQKALKDSLHISLHAAKKRQEPLDHTLFYGPPGLGKTTLSMVMAYEMGASIHVTSAPALERPRDIVGLLMSLQEGDVLFIDEIHQLNKIAEEILYPALEDFTLDRTIGKGPTAKILRVPLPKFTLIGATTKAGALSGPLRDRFGMVYRLNFYDPDELANILHRSAGILGMALSASAAMLLAARSRGTPRIANRLLKRVRDFADVKHANMTTLEAPIAEDALTLFEIDGLGLDATDRRLLQLLVEQFGGGPVGLETLANTMGEDTRTLEDVYEPYLLQAGLLSRTPRGRMATIQACQHLGLGIPAAILAQQGLNTYSLFDSVTED